MEDAAVRAHLLQQNDAAYTMRDLLHVVVAVVNAYHEGKVQLELPAHTCPATMKRWTPFFVRNRKPAGRSRPYVPVQVAKFLNRTQDAGKNVKADKNIKTIFDWLEQYQLGRISEAVPNQLLDASRTEQLGLVRELRRDLRLM